MIKAMIVDDERLVRKGFISMMPLRKYGIEIVAEERNGKAALEALKRVDVELLFTDLTMPIMGGFELIEQVRKLYPRIKIVVLTCHEDFKYIQKAIRLGAIDYIVKLELEDEEMEEVLKRISLKLAADEVDKSDEGQRSDTGLLYALRPGRANEIVESDWHAAGRKLIDIDRGFKLQLGGDGFETRDDEQGYVIKLRGLQQTDPSSLVKQLQIVKNAVLFYSDQPEKIAELNLNEPVPLINENEEDVKTGFDRCTNSLAWLHDETAFQHMVGDLRRLNLHPGLLKGVFYSATSRWFMLLPSLAQAYHGIEHCLYWVDWVNWLRETKRLLLSHQLTEHGYSRDIVKRILEAVEFISGDHAADLGQDEVARRFHLSRSYFSQSFKDIVGKPFQHYVKDLRMEKAKHLLLHTDMQVGAIATLCGYEDHRYFSRIFREETGLLPTEFRQAKPSAAYRE